MLSLYFGAASAILLCVTLTMRGVCVAVDMWLGYPWRGRPAFGFGARGLLDLSMLLIAAIVTLRSTGDRRLITCTFWICAAIGVWGSLLLPVYRVTATGGIYPTGVGAFVMSGLSILVAAFVLVDRRITGGQFAGQRPSEGQRGIPGLRSSCVAIGSLVAVLVWYQLLIPQRGWRVVLPDDLVMTVASAWLVAHSCLLLGRSSPGGNLADVASTLVTLAMVGTVMSLFPLGKEPLGSEYPRMFTAIVTGLGLSCILWSALCPLSQATGTPGIFMLVVHGPHLRRAVMFSAALGIIAATLLAFWPQLAGIASRDRSPGRLMGGLGAIGLLTVAVIFASRRIRLVTFPILTLLSIGTMVSFLLVRGVPFRN